MATKKEKETAAAVEEGTAAVVNEEVKNEVAPVEEPAEDNGDSFDLQSMEGIDLGALGFSEEDVKTLSGLDAIDSSEIRIPYATLISKVTRDNKVGDIVFADGTTIDGGGGEVVPDISVLKIQPVRVYFPQPFSPKNSYVCRSLDGKVGAPDGEYAGRPCAECEFSKYPEGGGSSPCRDQRLLLCTKADGSLFHLQIGGVGVGVWKTFMSSQVFHLLPKAKGILGFLRMDMRVKMIDTDFGPFPAIDFKIDPKKPFHSKDRLVDNLNALKSYKEFESFHVSTAADQARVQMAAGENEQEGEGNEENKTLF